MHHLSCYAILLAICLIHFDAKAQLSNHTAEQTRAVEQLAYNAALQWAARNQFPLHIKLDDQRAIGLVRMENDLPVFLTTHNQAAGQMTHTNVLHNGVNQGPRLTGVGLYIGIWDEGAVLDTHQELDFRVDLKDMGSYSNHATHVAGTLIASGVQSEARGMSPSAQITSFNWNFHVSEMQSEANRGLLISNHSYGRIAGWHLLSVESGQNEWYWFGDPTVSKSEDYVFGYYDQDAFLFDHVTYSNPHFLPVVSAGNERDDLGPGSGSYRALDPTGRWVLEDLETRPIGADGGLQGYDTITSFALAKNALTVGSVTVDANNQVKPSTFSSAGPTDDGRIKPDIMGYGENLFSSIASGPTGYARYTGTSMATPNVAGSLLLLQQLAQQLRNQPIRSATLKGIVAHTATDLGAKGPDFHTGWGLLNTAAAADLISAAFSDPGLINESSIEDGTEFHETLQLNTSGPVKITLSWTDPPGDPSTLEGTDRLNNNIPVLVNDLDIRLSHVETGQIFRPYKLSLEAPEKPAEEGDNLVDPIEQIFIEEAPAGEYALTVSHKGMLKHGADQPYSLIFSGLSLNRNILSLDSASVASNIGDVLIKWHTGFESQQGHFIIERAALTPGLASSTLSFSYQPVAEIMSSGTADTGQSYSFVDEIFLTGFYQYRILFEDATDNSRLLVAELNADIPAPDNFSIVSIYPNPMRDQATIVIDLPEDMAFSHQVFDLLGRQVYPAKEEASSAGRHFIRLNTALWSPGIYFAQIQSDTARLIRKIVVVR